MKDLIKKQEEELLEITCKIMQADTVGKINKFLEKVRKEIAEYVCDEMLEKRLDEREEEHFNDVLYVAAFDEADRKRSLSNMLFGYNRKKRQIEQIKQSILQKFK